MNSIRCQDSIEDNSGGHLASIDAKSLIGVWGWKEAKLNVLNVCCSLLCAVHLHLQIAEINTREV